MYLKKKEEDLVEDLKSSTSRVGKLYPVLEDFHGNVIDGHHRLKADERWPRMRLENVKTEKDRMIARLVSNGCRRRVPAKEKREMLDKLGQILLEGVKPGQISKRIAEETGMSYRWVVKYLPEKYKDCSQSERASSAARRTAGISRLLKLLKPPKQKLLETGNYTNAKRVLLTVEKSFYGKIEEAAELLKTTPDTFIQNIIDEKVREVAALKREDIEALQRALSAKKEENWC